PTNNLHHLNVKDQFLSSAVILKHHSFLLLLLQ
uniref:Uncharacterized protein n=1 Tax=Amphimedon queenslandica TaxID=400682 RepID=A0A1X7SGX9_AMPQE